MRCFFKLDVDLTDYFGKWLDAFQDNSENFREKDPTCLSDTCFATINLLSFIKNEQFIDNLNYIKHVCEKNVLLDLNYFYVHMIDYKNGGLMERHNHKHNEDYSFIYYLNDCDDGQTILHLKKDIKIKPIKNTILIFPSNIDHSSEYSNKKRILVGGLRTK